MVIIDYRNICKISSYSILSGSIACCFPTETEEIAHRIAKRIYCLRLDYADDQIILANDRAPYWRTAYINKWYSAQGLEPIAYKGNRDGMAWSFASSKERLNEVYDVCEKQLADALDLTIYEDNGLEADDIWGILASTTKDKIIGVSSDSDWRQLCSETINVLDPSTNILHKDPVDIRPKLISGDRGDNVMGCNKRRKDGSLGATNWGIDGAQKLLTKKNWSEGLDEAVLEKNYNVIKLPPPLWNLNEAKTALDACRIDPKLCDVKGTFDSFGLTEPVRKLLTDRSERDAWIAKMRAHLQIENNKEKMGLQNTPAVIPGCYTHEPLIPGFK